MDDLNGNLGLVESDEEQVFQTAYPELPAEVFPTYGSHAFWQLLENVAACRVLSLETLVRYVRYAVAAGDTGGRKRLIELIIWRVQATNETWARYVLCQVPVEASMLTSLAGDLYADLCERLIRAFIDPRRRFWEENFLHCLRFERQHTYQAFLAREGYWRSPLLHRGRRIPRIFIYSLDRPDLAFSENQEEWNLEDEGARQDLLQVEQSELLYLILTFPAKLRSVLLLIFWEGQTERETARILGVTDRTVRNRLHEAFKLVREHLRVEGEG